MALVVVAEDDNDIRALLLRVLQRDGHTVIETKDGAAALAEVLAHPAADAVVSDIDMPEMTGLELCRAIRARPDRAHLPVILVSGSLMPGDEAPEQAEATALLRKPFRPAELTSCLREVLSTGHAPGQAPCTCD